MQVAIPFPLSPSQANPARAGVGRLVNVIAEEMASGALLYKRAPGISSFATSASGSTHCRGFVRASDTSILVIFDGFVEAITMLGDMPEMVALGALDGVKIASVAVNNKTPVPDIVAVTENGAFLLSTSGPPVTYPDIDVGNPNSVCFGDGYFFFTYGSGACIASALNGTAINPLDQITINSASDGCVRGVWYSETLFLFTPSRCEAWSNTANEVGFPFSRAAVIPRGLITANAVAGYESHFTSSLIWVGSDNIVYLMKGYDPYRISTNDIERRISDVTDKATFRANVYMSEGHAFWQLSSSDFTLTYDLINSVWQERSSHNLEFSRIEQSIYAFNRWLVGDYSTGKIGEIDNEAFDEYGEALVWEITSHPAAKFPERAVISRADFDFIAGTGKASGVVPMETDPMISIQWSDNGGASFSMPLLRELGKIGEHKQAITVLRSGQAARYGRVWRLQVADPVYVGFLGGTMEGN